MVCRDENAARNILELGLRTAEHVGTPVLDTENACGHNYLYSRNGDGLRASSVEEPGSSNCEVGIPRQIA